MKSTYWIGVCALVMGLIAGGACMSDSGGGGGGDDDDDDDAKCGDKTCDPSESNATCPADCPPAGPRCGDMTCAPTETNATCPADCPAVCNNRICEAGEQQTCPADCPAQSTCNNRICEAGEQTSCPNDCPATLQVRNQSSYTIYNLYVRRCADTSWGVDQTGPNYISPGFMFTLSGIPPGCYFFRATDAAATHTWMTPNGVELGASVIWPWTLIN